MTKPLETLMQKEMSRKEFIATLGFGLASVMGLGAIIKLLTGKSLHGRLGQPSLGYGSSAYGGRAESQ